MNILLVPARYYPLSGGLETVVSNLASQLKKKGHKVGIITTRNPFYLKPKEIINGIEVKRLPFLFFGFQYYMTGRSRLKRMFLCLYSFFKLAYFIIRFRPQIVNLHYVSTQAVYVTLLSYFFHFKYVVTIHGLGLQELPDAPRYVRWIYRWVLKRADFIISVSLALLDDAERRVGNIENKSIVIHNGIDPDEFSPSVKFEHRRPYILAIGNFHIYKGFDLLVMAFSHISDKYDVDLIIAGDGPQRNNLEELSQLLEIEERVHFFGIAEKEEIISLLNGCEFLVLPSRIEPFGIVSLEAMAAGKAVIAYNVDGVPEIIKDGVNGLLVKPKSDKELAKAMAKLLEDKPLRDKLAENGRRIVEAEFNADKQSDAFLKVYYSQL